MGKMQDVEENWSQQSVLKWIESLLENRPYITFGDMRDERVKAGISQFMLDDVLCHNLFVFVPRRKKTTGEIIFILQHIGQA